MVDLSQFNEEDAFHAIVAHLRSSNRSDYSNYGYGLYLPNAMRSYLTTAHKIQFSEADAYIRTLSPSFYAAAWEMCRRGILRPGVKEHGLQATSDGGGGNGYSVTPSGNAWLAEAGHYDFVPTESGRFSRMLDSFTPRYGQGFWERSQEALKCYQAHAYLACCAMCGAAAESVMLALAVAKTGDEVAVLKEYSGQNGRSKVENLIIGTKTKSLQAEFKVNISLLKYWRDNASHGKQVRISENEAFTSLAILLRFAQFASDRWNELTSSP